MGSYAILYVYTPEVRQHSNLQPLLYLLYHNPQMPELRYLEDQSSSFCFASVDIKRAVISTEHYFEGIKYRSTAPFTACRTGM